MRYIDKSDYLNEWDEYVRSNSPTKWSKVSNAKKLALHKHAHQQQNGLCIYCEQTIPPKTKQDDRSAIHPSHLEHLLPKGLSTYKSLTFDQKNIAVCCLGFTEGTYILRPDGRVSRNTSINPEFCGHYKDNQQKETQFDETLFLNPHELVNISSYFGFNIEGEIHGKNDSAKYMIALLQLDHTKLVIARQESYTFAIERSRQGEPVEAEIKQQEVAFCTMLNQLFGLNED